MQPINVQPTAQSIKQATAQGQAGDGQKHEGSRQAGRHHTECQDCHGLASTWYLPIMLPLTAPLVQVNADACIGTIYDSKQHLDLSQADAPAWQRSYPHQAHKVLKPTTQFFGLLVYRGTPPVRSPATAPLVVSSRVKNLAASRVTPAGSK